MRYSFYRYTDALPGLQPWAWGGYDICVTNRSTGECEPLDLARTYRVATNEFLPCGQDGFVQFKYMTNINLLGRHAERCESLGQCHLYPNQPVQGAFGRAHHPRRHDSGGSIVPVTIFTTTTPTATWSREATWAIHSWLPRSSRSAPTIRTAPFFSMRATASRATP